MNTRRKFLRGLAGMLGLGATGAWATDEAALQKNRNELLRFLMTGFDNSKYKISKAPAIDADVCILTQSQVEGPYQITAPTRSDVTEGKPGAPFELTVQVVASDGCTPVAGVMLEIWHCDAAGIYSGHPDLSRDIHGSLEYLEWGVGHKAPTNKQIWLRGVQKTDDDGVVTFRTIFPGWYDMRAPHIHFKIGGPQRELFTSQFYFDDTFANDVYRNHPDYKEYGACPYRPDNDLAVAMVGGAEGLVLDVRKLTNGAMRASAKVGIELPAA